MNSQEFLSLQKAYLQVVENQQLNEELHPSLQQLEKKSKAELAKLAAEKKEREALKLKKKTTRVGYPVPDYLPKMEEFEGDIFDYVLEYLVAEGYADTNKSAIAIMANMSEEWIENILEEKRPLPVDKIDNQITRKRETFDKHLKNKDLYKAQKVLNHVKVMVNTVKNHKHD
jgi:hypothetical protein